MAIALLSESGRDGDTHHAARALVPHARRSSTAPSDLLISRRLRRVDLGVVSRVEIDLPTLVEEARAIESIIERSLDARWSPGRVWTR
jgi:hypothetical protein